jgi:hypothetical protein
MSLFRSTLSFGLLIACGHGTGEFKLNSGDEVHSLKRREDVINIDEYHDRYCKPLYACEGIGKANLF